MLQDIGRSVMQSVVKRPQYCQSAWSPSECARIKHARHYFWSDAVAKDQKSLQPTFLNRNELDRVFRRMERNQSTAVRPPTSGGEPEVTTCRAENDRLTEASILVIIWAHHLYIIQRLPNFISDGPLDKNAKN